MGIFEERIITRNHSEDAERKVVMKFENLSKKYGKHLAVDNMNIEVYEGETIGLVGPNGAGKTTTIKMIAKLLRPTEGRILIRNYQGKMQDLQHNSKNLIKRGFLIDVPFFYADMTAYQHLEYFASSQHYPEEKIDERIDELLDLFKLSDWKHEKVKSFSKGMRQKLGIIQSILVDPQIIILDEPQSGLDPKARIEIRQIIKTLRNEGKTIFVASHMLHEISEVCDRIALLNHGQIIAFDTIDNLEGKLKTKQLMCEIMEPINGNAENIIHRMIERLHPYLDQNLDENISDSPIVYNETDQTFKIYYNSGPDSKVKILRILIEEFKEELKIESYTEPKTSQLERIYSEMIVGDAPRVNIKEVKKS